MQLDFIFFIVYIVLATLLLIFFIYKFLEEKKKNNFFTECKKCEEKLIEEQRRIRHEYNNILQTIICYIEEGDLKLLSEYKKSLMENVQNINKNSLINLAGIKDMHIRLIVFNLIERANQSGVKINLTVSQDIKISNKEMKNDRELMKYLWQAYGIASKENDEIDVNININEGGISFLYKSRTSISPDELTSNLNYHIKDSEKNKTIFYNTLIKENTLVQEIVKLQ